MANTYKLELKSYYDDEMEETAYPFLQRLSVHEFSKSDTFIIDKDVNAFFIQNDKFIKIPGPCEIKIGKIEELEKPFFGKVKATVCCFEKYEGRVFEAVWDKDSFLGVSRDIYIDRKDIGRRDKFTVDYEFKVKYIVKDELKVCKKFFNIVKNIRPNQKLNDDFIGKSYDDCHVLDEYVSKSMPMVFQYAFKDGKFINKGRYLPEIYTDEENAELSGRFLDRMNYYASDYGLEILKDESEFTLKKFDRYVISKSNTSPTNKPLGSDSGNVIVSIRPFRTSRYIYQYDYSTLLPETKLTATRIGNWAFVKRNYNGNDELMSVYSPAYLTSPEEVDLKFAFNSGVLNPNDKCKSYNEKFPYVLYYLPTIPFSKELVEFKDVEFLRPDGSKGGKISFDIEFQTGEENVNGLDVKKAMEFILDNCDLDTTSNMKDEFHPYPMNILKSYIENGIRENLWEYYDTLNFKFVENNLYEKPKIVTSLIPGILEAKIREQLHIREKFYELTGYTYREDYYPELIINRLEFYK